MIFESSENDTKLGVCVCVFFLENGCGRLPDVCWTCLHSRKNLNFKSKEMYFLLILVRKSRRWFPDDFTSLYNIIFLSQPFTYQSTFQPGFHGNRRCSSFTQTSQFLKDLRVSAETIRPLPSSDLQVSFNCKLLVCFATGFNCFYTDRQLLKSSIKSFVSIISSE